MNPKSSLPQQTNLARQTGFSILEVLITVMIASIALAALAQLQLNSVRTNHGALLTTYAAMHARDMSERMVANPAGAASLAGVETVVAHYHIDLFDGDTAPTASSACQTNSLVTCTAAMRAQTDYAEWLQAISSDMPAGTRAQVCLGTAVTLYSFAQTTTCDATATLSYVQNSSHYLQDSFPVTYYLRIEYPFRNETLGLVMPVELDAYAKIHQ